MTDFEYLTIDQLIEINCDQAPGSSVLDPGGLESAAHRPATNHFGTELFPDIWTKAAAYVHSIAGPQYFFDGNKRTGWFAAATFLSVNGYPIPEVPAIDAEFFVQAVAQDVFRTDAEYNETILKAAEWFRSKWANQSLAPKSLRRRGDQSPQLEYAMLAHSVAPRDHGIIDVQGLGVYTFGVTTPFPAPVDISVIGRLHWDELDPLVPQELKFTVHSDGREPVRRRSATLPGLQALAKEKSFHAHHHGGRMPLLFWRGFTPVFREQCTARIDVSLNDELLVSLPFQVVTMRGT